MFLIFPLLIFLVQSEERLEFQKFFSYSVPYHIQPWVVLGIFLTKMRPNHDLFLSGCCRGCASNNRPYSECCSQSSPQTNSLGIVLVLATKWSHDFNFNSALSVNLFVGSGVSIIHGGLGGKKLVCLGTVPYK